VTLADGQGQRVVLATGYMAGASSATALQTWLAEAGYDVVVADLRRNVSTSTSATERIIVALEHGGSPSILIGHSRGGQQCRVATQRHPELVSQLITLAAPVRAHLPRQILLRASVETLRILSYLPIGPNDDRDADALYEADLLSPFGVDVPWTSIWSKSDGVVEWQACVDESATPCEVRCSHIGMLASVPSFRGIADVLENREP